MWLIPSTSLAYSADQECSTKPSDAPCQCLAMGIEWWVTLSGNVQRRPCSWRGWKNRGYHALLCGATKSQHWTPDLCADLSTCSPQAHHANRTALPEKAKESMTRAVTDVTQNARKESLAESDGNAFDQAQSTKRKPKHPCRIPSESSTKVDPPWSTSKMFENGLQAGLFNDSAKNYAQWVIRSKTQSSSLRRTLERRIYVNASLSWHTPSARGDESQRAYQYDNHDKTKPRPSLVGQGRNWGTPDTMNHMAGTLRKAAKAGECFPPDETNTDDGLNSLLQVWTPPTRPRLSPGFQWWLMGWPHPRNFYESAEMESCHFKQQSHSASCGHAQWDAWRNQIKYATRKIFECLCQ